MREPSFLRQNKDKWLEYEELLFSDEKEPIDPDHLAELYIQLTDDLAYARTFYPKSQSVRYLNGLAARTHLFIYKNKKEKRNQLFHFWAYDLPVTIRETHRFIWYAFLIFGFGMLIGGFSEVMDQGYVRTIMGDSYVNMTLDNISQGDPTAVYKQGPSFNGFIRIAFHNLSVAFLAFSMGIFFSYFTMEILFSNGIMVGSFIMFFFNQGVIVDALPVVFIHGTLELSAIVIAGGSGLLLGHSFLFPKTHTRKYAVTEAAKKGIKIIFGLVPVFLMAGFLEGYVTRHSDMPFVLNMLIILVSAIFVGWYYIWYPIKLSRKLKAEAIMMNY